MEGNVITFLVRAIRRNRIIIATRAVVIAFQLVTTHDAASQSMAVSERLPGQATYMCGEIRASEDTRGVERISAVQ
jgi:hypothetical protein